MAKQPDGGPAFPDIEGYVATGESPAGTPSFRVEGRRGMSLRDFFAAQAMVGLSPCVTSNDLSTVLLTPAAAATRAYLIADAMLAQRDEP